MSFARIFILISILVSSSFAFAAGSPRAGDLECRKEGYEWHVWNRLTGHEVGESTGRGGFPNQESCQWSINEAVKAGQDMVCGWNEVGFSAYYLPTNRVVGESDIAWRFLRDCIDVIEKNANGMVCNYAGQYWMSYDIKTNARQCSEHDGYRTQDDCLWDIRHNPNQPVPQPQPQPQPSIALSCQWNGYSWQPHNELVGFVGLQRYGFAYERDCHLTVHMARRNAVCNWDGVGFKPYDVRTNATLATQSYGSLESCYAIVP